MGRKTGIDINVQYGFWSAVICGILAHGFMVTNIINNWDSLSKLSNPSGTGGIFVLKTGRWFLYVLTKFMDRVWGNYTLPYFNGLTAVLFLALSAGIIIKLFDIRNHINAILIGSIMLAFPSVVSGMFYMFIVHYYALAVLLVCISVLYIDDRKKCWISVFCLCLSLGIYQAFLPIWICLVYMKIILFAFQNEEAMPVFKKCVGYFMILLFSIFSYVFIMKSSMWLTGEQLWDYQGAGNVLGLSIGMRLSNAIAAYSDFIHLPNRLFYAINHTFWIRKSLLLIWILFLYFVLKMIKQRYQTTHTNTIFLCVLLAIFPLCVNSIGILFPESGIYTLMVYANVFLYVYPLVFMEKLAQKTAAFRFPVSKIVSVIIATCILNYIWQANGNYTAAAYANKQAWSYAQELVIRIKSTPGYEKSMPVFFIGKEENDSYGGSYGFDDPNFKNIWNTDLFDVGGSSDNLINTYSFENLIKAYTGFNPDKVSEEEKKIILKHGELQMMACYPDSNSIKTIDHVIVVKLK